MQEILALSLQSIQQDMERVNHIGTNMANILTPGFKREIVSTPVLGLGVTDFAAAFAGQSQNQARLQTSQAELPRASAPLMVQADARPGTLKSTGEALDVAIAGPGYFEVATENGPAYTRQGNFQIDARGRLVTAQGYLVMGKGGEIFLNGIKPVIDATGNLYEAPSVSTLPSKMANPRLATHQGPSGDPAVAQLKVVQFQDANSMQRLGNGLYSAGTEVAVLKDADIQLRQGYLENSNVSSMTEMVNLIQTMRHLETMQKVALAYDDMTGQAVRKLGDL